MARTTRERTMVRGPGGGNVVYGLGLIGALVHYLGRAGDFGAGVVGVLKALVWPAFLVFDVFRFVSG